MGSVLSIMPTARVRIECTGSKVRMGIERRKERVGRSFDAASRHIQKAYEQKVDPKASE